MAGEFVNSLRTGRVIRSAAQEEQLLLPMLDAATEDQVFDHFLKSWSAPHRLILVTGNVDLPDTPKNPDQLIKEIYLQSSATAVQPPADIAAVSFPYLPEPTAAGTVSDRVTH